MGEALSKPLLQEPEKEVEHTPFVPCIETAARVVLLWVRKIHGRDPVGYCEAVKGYGESDSKGKYRRASLVTYPSHSELSNAWYAYLQSLESQEAFVRRTLGRAGIEAINRDDIDPYYRMNWERGKFLESAYKRIARRFRISAIIEEVEIN